jgi:hypothetical protein
MQVSGAGRSRACGYFRRLTPRCRYRAVGRSRVSFLQRGLACQQRPSTTVSGIDTRSTTRAAHIFPSCHRVCARSLPRTPVASAVHAAASSRQGSEDSCGWAILSHGDDEPHIAQGILYTLKRPMHEPI